MLTRREFLKKASMGVLGAGFLSAFDSFAASKSGGTQMKYRILGRTGLKVSAIGFGSNRVHNSGLAPLYKAFEMGVNYIDTAPSYGRGKSESTLSEFLKDHRDEVILATKWHVRFDPKTGNYKTDKEDLIGSLEESLKRLKVEMVDIIQVHGAARAEQVRYDELFEAFDRLKRDGKVRFLGFTTHTNQDEVINAALKTDKFDVTLAAYNFMMKVHEKAKAIEKALRAAKEAGLGVINMKAIAPMKGVLRYASDPKVMVQASIRWVLAQSYTSMSVIGMSNAQEVEQDLGALSEKLSKAQERGLEHIASALSHQYCRMCGTCERNCPQGIAIVDIMRFRMYHRWYGDKDASLLYAELPPSQRFDNCTECGRCTEACPHGLAVLEMIRDAHSTLVHRRTPSLALEPLA